MSDKIKIPDIKEMPVESDSLLRWLSFFIFPYKKVIWGFLWFRLARYTAFAMLPPVIGFTIDAFGKGTAQNNPWFYGILLFSYLFLYAILAVGTQVFYFEVNAYEKVSRGITLLSMNHIAGLPLEWHERQGSGGKMQRIMTARKAFFELARIVRWNFFPVIGGIASVILSAFLNDTPFWYIPLYLLFLTSYLCLSAYLGRPVSKLYDGFNESFERLLSRSYEFISSIRTVKAFGLQDYINDKAKTLEGHGQVAIEKVHWKNFVRWASINGLGCIWLFVFAGLGFVGCIQGWMTAGTFTATFFLAFNLLTALEVIAAMQEQIYEYCNGLRRLISTLKEKTPPLDITPIVPLSKDWKTIKFNKVSFRYTGAAKQGLHDISFTVQRGEKIAFVGHSGAGKSTMAKLLMKQMLCESGELTIDDVDLKHIAARDWLSHIGFVPQDVELFDMSIRENILIDREEVDEDLYNQVLKDAALDEFVLNLPEGDATMIGERGIKLSGGQRQRLGIARAMIRQSDILIFDEATSALDSISEQQIQLAMENSFKGRTVFLIAHRLSTLRHVDRVIVLHEGSMIEEGNFRELAEQDGYFSKLWSVQTASLTV